MSLHRIQTGKVAKLLPFAHMLHGSVVKFTTFGWSERHARRRAERRQARQIGTRS
ncbi:hypothetical protein ACFVAJ_17965 [Agromyces sp. NPDC057679]|uniref:hypothetical protein n=1 Tax=Agromyces sp. NPDC057679 TaxID=3346207 RepID=UPI00366D9A94